jgi:tRNA 5-methylaminomethyl-2-thiouridine biosynthesis bifunctional protein
LYSEFAPFSLKNNTLFSEEFDDLYSSAKGAVAECNHVFIKGNNLNERFENLGENSKFYIGEIGFGIGINFLTTCKSWLDHTKQNQVLEFYSFDKYLFRLSDFKTLNVSCPDLKEYISELERNYPRNIQGAQKISLFGGRIILNLIIGEIDNTQEYIKLMDKVDAWYFDGFSPSKNPDLWSIKLFKCIHKSCHENTTFSTYTSSGLVKNNLTESGFNHSRAMGFSDKRHMLKGTVDTQLKKNTSNTKVAVIGSGIAGCILSYTLAKKGIEVDLYEKSDSICSGASSHELLVTYPRLSAHDTAFGSFTLHSYIFATNFYKQLKTDAWKKTGVIILNHDAATEKRQSSLLEKRADGEIYRYIDPDEASEISGIDIKLNGLIYEDAGYILPEEMCKFLIESPKINIFTSSHIKSIKKNREVFNLNIGKKKFEYQNVCVCAGSETANIVDIDGISIKRGQVTHIESLDNISRIKLPICAKGYISPRVNNIHLVGSSYSDSEDTDLSEEEHLYNLNNLKLVIDEEMNVITGQTGHRAVSKDHMPVVGMKDGIYINTCHGSRASVTAPISAEIIASMIVDEAPPLMGRELESLSPERFN